MTADQLTFPTAADVCALVASDPANKPSVDHILDTFHRFPAGAHVSRNTVSPLLAPWVNPSSIGAVFSGLVAKKALVWTGAWDTSTDHRSRNSGKPCKVYVWHPERLTARRVGYVQSTDPATHAHPVAEWVKA